MMKIPLISSIIHYYFVVYSYAGKKLYILLLLFLFGGVSESIGISILLPVLNYDKSEGDQGQYAKLIYNFLESVGISVSIFSLIMILFIAFLFKGIFVFLQKTLASYINCNLIKDMRIDFCDKYKNMQYRYYTNTGIGYLNNIVTTEIVRAVAGINRYTVVIGNLIFILIYISFAVIINYKMTLIVLFLSLLLFTLMRGLSRSSKKKSLLLSETNAQTQSLLIQTIYNFKYIKATNSFTHIFKHLHDKIKKNYIYQFRLEVLLHIPFSIIEPIAVLILSGLVLYYVGFMGKTIAEILVLMIFFYKAFN